MDDDTEGVGESTWPPAAADRGASSSAGGGGGGSHGYTDIAKEVFDRLLEKGNPEVVADPPAFLELLHRHFDRLPLSYAIDVNVDKAEDVLLHRRILNECADPEKRPIFHVRFLHCAPASVDSQDNTQGLSTSENGNCGDSQASTLRGSEPTEFEPCEGMEDLSLTGKKVVDNSEASSSRRDVEILHIHEIIFSTVDKPKLLAQLSALLSEVGLNIREAHVFSTTDGFCLDVFVVDGWDTEETDTLLQILKETAARNHASLSNPTNSAASQRILELQEQIGDSNVDRSFLQIGEKIASGSSGDLYRGTYQGMDVAVKFLRTEHVTDSSKVEFLQEIFILKSVNHDNVVRFYGACTKKRKYVIVTEYMPGGNLYDFLHKLKNTLDLTAVLRIAIGISKGMDYLHQNNIIHRDLKTANLLMGSDYVVKIADFGVSRNPSQEGDMTAETGTYRWMAPEVINHKPYDHRADIFSFAVVLWELVTSKIPYENLTPLQAALGVRQGMRLEIPSWVHPQLSKLIQQCWDENPNVRPSFSEITVELEGMLRHHQASKGINKHSKAKVHKKSQR